MDIQGTITNIRIAQAKLESLKWEVNEAEKSIEADTKKLSDACRSTCAKALREFTRCAFYLDQVSSEKFEFVLFEPETKSFSLIVHPRHYGLRESDLRRMQLALRPIIEKALRADDIPFAFRALLVPDIYRE